MYERILELDSESIEAKMGISTSNDIIQSFEIKQRYIKDIKLYQFKTKYYSTYFDDKVPSVVFKIKHSSKKALKLVEVTVFFRDKSGRIIHEEKFYPANSSPYAFGDRKPLKPSYIWQLEKDEFNKAEKVPSEWKSGSITAKITDIDFE
jgi:hypothetical protein